WSFASKLAPTEIGARPTPFYQQPPALHPMEPPTRYPSSIRAASLASYTHGSDSAPAGGEYATGPGRWRRQCNVPGLRCSGGRPGSGAATAASAFGFRTVLLFRRVRLAGLGPGLATELWRNPPGGLY